MSVKLYTYIADKTANEEGEIASWLILAAGLCIAAGTASGILQTTVERLANAVGA